MKTYVAASSSFWDKLPEVKEKLERLGHEVKLPKSIDDSEIEEKAWQKGDDEHVKLIRSLFDDSEKIIRDWCDAIYLMNWDKRGISGYVGGAALVELYIAYREHKKIFIENDVFPGLMYDEIMGFGPTFVHGDLSKIA
ncbi:hypothetical protein IKF04_01715 [Candidatus Saccharibacteria bacterium]|nr:hypothetical protein [Candidatus Saccharibacteria bacterium]